MLRLHKNKKAQNTAEYAILIALVIGAVVAMQTYAQRALQGRLRDAAVELTAQTTQLGCSLQYEPYYLNQRTRMDKRQRIWILTRDRRDRPWLISRSNQ